MFLFTEKTFAGLCLFFSLLSCLFYSNKFRINKGAHTKNIGTLLQIHWFNLTSMSYKKIEIENIMSHEPKRETRDKNLAISEEHTRIGMWVEYCASRDRNWHSRSVLVWFVYIGTRRSRHHNGCYRVCIFHRHRFIFHALDSQKWWFRNNCVHEKTREASRLCREHYYHVFRFYVHCHTVFIILDKKLVESSFGGFSISIGRFVTATNPKHRRMWS